MQEKEWEFKDGSLYYVNHGESIEITRMQGLASEVKIPDTLEDLPVTEIGKKAFLSRKNLRKVWLPSGMVCVGDWAFAYCDHLTMVALPGRAVTFGKAVFLDCHHLASLPVGGKSEEVGPLLAAAVTVAEANYLLDISEAGSGEWLQKWDARMLSILHSDDHEGYSRQVLCGEEDYGSTDLTAYENNKRKRKVRLLLLRLLWDKGLDETVRKEATFYLQQHTKGCETEETWQVILNEHGDDSAYYRLFAQLECLHADNFDAVIADMGENHPEMKAFFLRYKEETIGYTDFFADLDL